MPGTAVVQPAEIGTEGGALMSSRKPKAPGVVTFAAVLFTIAGFFHGIEGLGAILKKEYFSEAGMLYSNLQVWGWASLILGILQISAAYMIIGRATAGRTLGIVVASISAIATFFSIEAHPLGGVLVIAIDVLIIYGLTVHADAFIPGGIEEGPMAPRPEPSGRPFA
jgi:hypothetical protein